MEKLLTKLDELNQLDQELGEKIEKLQTARANCQSLKTAISIIASLKSAETSIRGITSAFTRILNSELDGLSVTREGFDTFIRLLNTDEYIRGYERGGNDIFGPHPREHKLDVYYLTLGQGIVLEVRFRETTIQNSQEPVQTALNILAYTDSQDLTVSVDSESYRWPVINVLRQDGIGIFKSNAAEEYTSLNSQKLNDAITPISADTLAERFLELTQKPEEKEKTI